MRKPVLFTLLCFFLFTAFAEAQTTCCAGENLGGQCLGEDNCETFVRSNCDTLNNRCFTKWWTWPGTAITADDYVPANLVSSRRYEGQRALLMRPDANGAAPDVVKDLGDNTTGIHRLSWKMYVPAGKTGYFNIQHDFRRLMRGQPNWAYQVFFTPDGQVSVRVAAEARTRIASFRPDCWLKVTQVINLDKDSVHFFLNNRLVARWRFSPGLVDLNNDGQGDQRVLDKKLGAIDFYARDGFEYYIDKICWQRAPVFSGGNCPGTPAASYCLGGAIPYQPTNACGLPAFDGYVEGEEAFAGACNPGVSACVDAVAITCGQTLSNQTTGGITAKNSFSSKDFSSCVATQNAYGGNDKIYRIVVTEPSNLQATMNILDPAVNLDMFLLSSCLTYPFATTSQPECAYCIASSTNNNLSSREESFSVFLEPGTYFLVVDALQAGASGNFNLTLSCGCSCAEGSDMPNGPNVLCENFDVYNNGALAAQTNRWKRWDAAAADAQITTTSGAAGKVMRLTGNSTTQSDVLISLGNRTTGRYRLSWSMFVTRGQAAYYNIQHTDAGGANPNWAYQVSFLSSGQARLAFSSTVVGTFFYSPGTWFKVTQIIDLDRDVAELWMNNQMVHSWRFSIGNPVSSKVLGALNFYAAANNDFFIDNICMWAKDVACATGPNAPVCLANGRSYRNEGLARCDLYTAAELGPCVSVCDLGGTMIHRADRFSGTIGLSDQAPSLSWQDTCVTTTFTQRPLDTLLGHTYVFYNDEAKPFNISLTGTNGVRAFIYRCPQGGQSSTLDRFRCIGRDGETFTQKGYYYILVMATRPNTTYAFSVLPEGTCRANPTPIQCNVAVNGTLSGDNRYATNIGGNAYKNCYTGTRTFNGAEREYQFRLDQPARIHLSLQAQAGAGAFLYDFLCGKNCIAFAEIPDAGGTVRSDTLLLDPGVYYVIVDQAQAGGNGNFTLNVNCVNASDPLFLQDGVGTCAQSGSARHNVTLRTLRNSRFNGQRLNERDQILFFHTKNSLGQLLAANGNWNNSEIRIPLAEDATGDTTKCGFTNNELLVVKINKNNAIYDAIPVFQPVDGGTVTAGAGFAAGGASLITELRADGIPHSLRVSPAARKVPGQGGSFEVKVAANMNWRVRKRAQASWIKLPSSQGFANEVLRVEIDPNNSNNDRADTLYIIGSDNELQKVVVEQAKTACAAISVDLGADRSICRGDQVQISATVAGASFRWSGGQTTNSISVSPQVNATYSVTVTQNGCTGVDEVNINVKDIPVVDLGPDLGLCAGDGIVFVATGGDSYRWSTGATTANVNIRPTQRTTYSVTVTKDGCSGTDAIVVGIDQAPTVSITPAQNICAGQSVTLFATGGSTYLWDNGRTTASISVNPTTSKEYLVTVTNGNCSAIGRTTVNVTPSANVALGPDISICEGDRPTITANAGPGTYRWSNGASTSSITVSPSTNANFIVTVTNGNCISIDDINVNVAPKPTVDLGPDKSACSGQVLTLIPSGTGGVTYRWNTGATAASIQVQPTSAAEYAVTVTRNGCTATDQVNIGVSDPPIANAGPDLVLNCNITTLRLDGSRSSAGPSITYQWAELGGDGRITAGRNERIATINKIGNYNLLVTNTSSGCTSNDLVTVTGTEPVEITSIQLLEVRCFGEATGSATLTAAGGLGPYNFSWSNGSTGSAINRLKADRYRVTISDQGNCRDTVEIEIKQPDPIKLASVRITPAPSGNTGAIAVTITGGVPPYDYRWFRGNDLLAATQNISNLALGDYVLEVYDANNCSLRSSPITVGRTVAVAEPLELKYFNLYPNPTNAEVSLELELPNTRDLQISLYDPLGRELERRKMPKVLRLRENFDLSTRPGGIYWFKITDGKQVSMKPVMVAR